MVKNDGCLPAPAVLSIWLLQRPLSAKHVLISLIINYIANKEEQSETLPFLVRPLIWLPPQLSFPAIRVLSNISKLLR